MFYLINIQVRYKYIQKRYKLLCVLNKVVRFFLSQNDTLHQDKLPKNT